MFKNVLLSFIACVVPLKEVENTRVFSRSDSFDNHVFICYLEGKDFEHVPTWNGDQDLPVSIQTIRKSALATFEKKFSEYKSFRLKSINLIHIDSIDQWIFDITFDGTELNGREGKNYTRQIHLLSLLDGRIYAPYEE